MPTASVLGTLHVVFRRSHNLSLPNMPAPHSTMVHVLNTVDICNQEFWSTGRQHFLCVCNSAGELLLFRAIRGPIARTEEFWKTPPLITTASPQDQRCHIIAALGQHLQTSGAKGSHFTIISHWPLALNHFSQMSFSTAERRRGREVRAGAGIWVFAGKSATGGEKAQEE